MEWVWQGNLPLQAFPASLALQVAALEVSAPLRRAFVWLTEQPGHVPVAFLGIWQAAEPVSSLFHNPRMPHPCQHPDTGFLPPLNPGAETEPKHELRM